METCSYKKQWISWIGFPTFLRIYDGWPQWIENSNLVAEMTNNNQKEYTQQYTNLTCSLFVFFLKKKKKGRWYIKWHCTSFPPGSRIPDTILFIINFWIDHQVCIASERKQDFQKINCQKKRWDFQLSPKCKRKTSIRD